MTPGQAVLWIQGVPQLQPSGGRRTSLRAIVYVPEFLAEFGGALDREEARATSEHAQAFLKPSIFHGILHTHILAWTSGIGRSDKLDSFISAIWSYSTYQHPPPLPWGAVCPQANWARELVNTISLSTSLRVVGVDVLSSRSTSQPAPPATLSLHTREISIQDKILDNLVQNDAAAFMLDNAPDPDAGKYKSWIGWAKTSAKEGLVAA
ncbi:hypothetical protein NMY22_g9054 [Coprinellus aureogranulatus]|nr:hypothetical protein NMY22_g9054 [Coprinellus aureogranulatus]